MASGSNLWKRVRWLVLLVALIVLLPYLTSRLLSRGRRIQIRTCAVQLDEFHARVAGRPLRVACYNIAHGRGVPFDNWNGESKEVRLQRLLDIATQIREIDADIVALNEVDFDSSWSHGENQAEFLARNAGYPYWVEQRNLDFRIGTWKWRFGNAILSRHPVSEAKSIELPDYSVRETLLAGKKRGVAGYVNLDKTRFPSLPTIGFMAVHLSHRSEQLRVDSAKMIGEIVSDLDMPVIVAGDFNSSPPGFAKSSTTESGQNAILTFDESQRFQRSPVTTPELSEMTFPSNAPEQVIDWILIPNEMDFLDYQVINVGLSDHLPVTADVTVRTETAIP